MVQAERDSPICARNCVVVCRSVVSQISHVIDIIYKTERVSNRVDRNGEIIQGAKET